MAEAAHSTWSASGFEQKMLCPGSHVLQQGLPSTSSKYAAEGTAAHLVLTWALQQELPASAFIGRVIEADGFTFEVDDDMAGHVQTTLDYVTALRGDDGMVFADIRVNYSQYLGVEHDEAWGTADVIVARGDEIIVVDFKYGMGVEVSAERNPQMSLYALGALQAYNGLVNDFRRVRMAISQPRIRTAPSEWDCSVDDLEVWAGKHAEPAVVECNRAAAARVVDRHATYLRPGEKQCKFCRAKATCPALRAEVADTIGVGAADPDEFAADPIGYTPGDNTPEWLSACLSKVDLIEDWCKAIRAEAERRLLAGDGVPGYKLVQGKRGARQWASADEVEKTLKAMRLKDDEMYDFKLISPTSAEKLHKAGTIGPRQWPKLQQLIVRCEGAPHVAPETDPRPALVVTPVVDDFNDVTAEDLA